jgi:hypothetical protein
MSARKKFEKRKERERAVRKKILLKREKLRAEVKKARELQLEEEAATTQPSPELDKVMTDLKKFEKNLEVT